MDLTREQLVARLSETVRIVRSSLPSGDAAELIHAISTLWSERVNWAEVMHKAGERYGLSSLDPEM